jgi:hypothetical protein
LSVASRRSRRALWLGIPGLIVGVLAFVALWRVGTPPPREPGAAPAQKPVPLPPVSSPPEILVPASVGRRAVLERVAIDTIPSARTLWIGADGGRVFVVLDPDVKRGDTPVVAGGRVTLIGLIRRAPTADIAMRQWAVDADTAQTVERGGTYLHATEVRPAG